jgi:hypothetical protein
VHNDEKKSVLSHTGAFKKKHFQLLLVELMDLTRKSRGGLG